MKYCFGIDIGGTTVKLGLFQEDGKIRDKWEIKTRIEEKGRNILPDIAKSLMNRLEKEGISKEEVTGIGIGVPAPITEEGFVKSTANLGWEEKNVKAEMEELTGIRTATGNDANVAALGRDVARRRTRMQEYDYGDSWNRRRRRNPYRRPDPDRSTWGGRRDRTPLCELRGDREMRLWKLRMS